MLLGQSLRNRLQAIGGAQRDGADAAGRFVEPVLVLVIVEVAAGLRGHHDLVAPFRRLPDPSAQFRIAFLAPPVHHRCGRRQPPVHDLVPAEQPPAVPAEDGLDAADEVALQLLDVHEPFAPHPRPALGAPLPVRLVGLVSADVDELRREQREGLCEDVLDHGERPVVSRAVDVGGAAGRRVAPQLPHDLQDCRRMAGHLDLRHHRDAARGGERDDLPDVVLRVAAPVGQLRVLPDLEPPALVVHEVPVEAVQLVPRQRIQERADLLLGKEVPGAVQQHPSPREPGLVPDVQAGQLRGVRVQGQQLREALQAVEEPRGVGDAEISTPSRADDQVVRLRSGSVRLLQDDRSRVRLSDAKRELRQRFRRAYEQLRNRPELGPSRGYGDRHLAGERQTPCRRAHGCGNGDDGIRGCRHGTTSSITTGNARPSKKKAVPPRCDGTADAARFGLGLQAHLVRRGGDRLHGVRVAVGVPLLDHPLIQLLVRLPGVIYDEPGPGGPDVDGQVLLLGNVDGLHGGIAGVSLPPTE